ncbi:MAG TPA: hypothetical protein VJ753_02130 [Rhizomicrobium sp.]|nr:hypothetical protein [Rhizomicrobium sp.]
MPPTSDLALSPTFERARTLSSVLRWFFIVNFWVTAVWVAWVPLLLIWPEAIKYSLDGSLVSVASQPMPERINAVAAVVIRTAPALVLLYHAIKIFGCFTKGEVFAATPITHIRAAGLWTIIWAFAPSAAQLILEHHVRMKFEPGLLAFGIATFIAAHVMGEAQRIADENASIL